MERIELPECRPATVQHEFEIATMAGVTHVDQPEGTITLLLSEGSTMAELLVNDGSHHAVVFLDYRMLTQLMAHMGRVATEL